MGKLKKYALRDIPNSKDRKVQLFEEYAGGKAPKDFTSGQRIQLRAKVEAQLKHEGYNLRRYK